MGARMADVDVVPVDVDPLSKRWLGVDFRDLLPWEIEGLSVDHATFGEAMPFVAEHYPSTFGVHRGRCTMAR